MADQLRILLVGAHPADTFDNAGGTLCHHVQQGDLVSTLVLSQGTRVHDVIVNTTMTTAEEVPNAESLTHLIQQRSQTKRQEVLKACEILNIHDVRFLEYDDAVLTINEPLILAVAKTIRDIRPHVVITHWPGESGGYADQHAVTAQITLYAIQAASGIDLGDPNPPHRVAQVFFMATPSCLVRASVFDSRGGFYTDVIVDISDVIDRKLRALDCMQSQAYTGAYARKRVEAVDGSVGFFAHGGRVAYAEGFIRMYAETYSLLPVTDWARQWSTLSDAERFGRYCRLITNTIPKP